MTGFDLGDEADDADEPASEDADESAESETTENRDRGSGAAEPDEQTREQQGSPAEGSTTDPESDPMTEPQFGSGDAKQFPTYARPEVLEEFQQTNTVEIQPEAAARGLMNVEKREVYDAMFRLAISQPERVVDLIIEGRGLDPDNLD